MKKHKASASAEATLKPIETVYRGCRMRSRLEARWAVFMDCMGIEWEYEKEGYDLDGVWYLPDFWLPKQNMWMEVKGEHDGNWVQKAARLAAHSGKYVAVFIGSCSLPEEQWDTENGSYPNAAAVHDTKRWVSASQDLPYCEYGWCHCCNCGAIQIAYHPGCTCLSLTFTTDQFRSPQLLAAYAIVRAIRFDDHAFVASLTKEFLFKAAFSVAYHFMEETLRSPSSEALIRALASSGMKRGE
jgi:hypothetical protein